MRVKSGTWGGCVRVVYGTLLQSDTVQTYGHVKTGTRPVGVELTKKTNDLSASDIMRGAWSCLSEDVGTGFRGGRETLCLL